MAAAARAAAQPVPPGAPDHFVPPRSRATGSQLWSTIQGRASSKTAALRRSLPHSPPMTKRTPIIPPDVTVGDFLPQPEDGTLRPLKVLWDDREKQSALGETGGFLHGYTHTCNP